jgi:hypothetical protein
MPFKVQSRSNSLLIIRLNTGNTIHLAPGQEVPVSEYEITGNEKINKLRRSGAVAVAETPDVEGEESRKKPEKKSGKPSE